MQASQKLFSYHPYRTKSFSSVPVLPMSVAEMEGIGWNSCDIILVTGDAYVDHPSFGVAIIGRVLEANGFRVGIIAQPYFTRVDDFRALGRPNLFFGVTGGNMDSMVNRYTANRKIRTDDAYSTVDQSGHRPDRAVLVYTQRCREAFAGVPVIIGGIEASLRRVAHYDYWSDKVRRSILLDAKADLLVYGNGERQVVELAHRLASGDSIDDIVELRGTAFVRKTIPNDWLISDSTQLGAPTKATTVSTVDPVAPQLKGVAPYQDSQALQSQQRMDRTRCAIRIPAYEQVQQDPLLYAHASRILHYETNPGNARALIQKHNTRDLWLNPPPIPLTTEELDWVFELPYSRQPHPRYLGKRIPAYEMIRFSVSIMRGCFGGCTFCSIAEHEGRIIQNRSAQSIVREITNIRDKSSNFTGILSDLGGPTANMYRLGCKDPKLETACRKPSCVYPQICQNLNTNHAPLIDLYRRIRKTPGIKKALVASGVRYDLAISSPDYVRELVTHHVGGYLKIAPEHTEDGPLSKMMKPGLKSFYRFKELFDQYSQEAGKKQYLIPYFIAAHPGTTTEDMLNLALWLKRNNLRVDQVQSFLPSPMTTATAMYYTGKNPLSLVGAQSENVSIPKGQGMRRLHKAFLRYHDATQWHLLRKELKRMGRMDLIGNGKEHLIPFFKVGTQKFGSL